MLSGFGEVKSVRRQKYIGSPEIETGTHLVLMTFKTIPPRLININGFFVDSGIRANPRSASISGICQSWGDYYSSLFSAESVDVRIQDSVFENLTTRLPADACSSCEGPVST